MNTNADALGFALMEHLGPAALTGGTMSIHDAFVLGWNAAPQAAAINAELLEACAAMVKWDDAENNAPDYLIDGGAHWHMTQALCSDAFSKARAAIARATQEAQK